MILDDWVQVGVSAPEPPGQSIVSTGRSARSMKGLCWTWGHRYRDPSSERRASRLQPSKLDRLSTQS
jgi:hypothetical protein